MLQTYELKDFREKKTVWLELLPVYWTIVNKNRATALFNWQRIWSSAFCLFLFDWYSECGWSLEMHFKSIINSKNIKIKLVQNGDHAPIRTVWEFIARRSIKYCLRICNCAGYFSVCDDVGLAADRSGLINQHTGISINVIVMKYQYYLAKKTPKVFNILVGSVCFNWYIFGQCQ